MDEQNQELITSYIYNYSYDRGERSLCELEMRAFFGKTSQSSIVDSSLKIDQSRSPFIQERIDVMIEGESLESIVDQVKELPVLKETFKVLYVNERELDKSEQVPNKVAFKDRRKIEYEVGLHVPGEADLINPDLLYGVMNVNGRWLFGRYHRNEAIWLHHQSKPHSYSTSLSTRVARAVANIAVPNPTGIKAIDPCCGIGTVLVEALSMGIDIDGSDINHFVINGVKDNIAHFNLEGKVTCQAVQDVTNHYDVAIIDMPYNLCSVITTEEQLEMLQSARRFARKLVIVTVEPIDSIIENAGFIIVDRGTVTKGQFRREVIVCE